MYCPLCGWEMELVEPAGEMHSSSMPDWSMDRWVCETCNVLWDAATTKNETKLVTGR